MAAGSHPLLTALGVVVLLAAGTIVLVSSAPNLFFAAGVAISIYGHALRKAFGLRRSGLKAAWSAQVLAGLLCAVGAAMHGGPIGIFGLTVSLVFSAFWLLALAQVWRT